MHRAWTSSRFSSGKLVLPVKICTDTQFWDITEKEIDARGAKRERKIEIEKDWMGENSKNITAFPVSREKENIKWDEQCVSEISFLLDVIYLLFFLCVKRAGETYRLYHVCCAHNKWCSRYMSALVAWILHTAWCERVNDVTAHHLLLFVCVLYAIQMRCN